VLKVTRHRENGYSEFFEFQNLEGGNKPFEVLAIKDLDTPLWNIHDFFAKHLKELVLGEPPNEFNPRLVLVRFGQIQSRIRLIVSYKKKKYDSA
jgi:hypothetical protein